jgi:hypothetical protein
MWQYCAYTSTEGANSHTRSGNRTASFLKAVWRATFARGAPKEQAQSIL